MKTKTHKYLSRQYMLSSDYEIFHYSSNDIARISLHHHDFYECYLFISGDVTYLIEGKTYYLKSGDIILINSKELHQAIVNNKDATYERIVLWMNRNFLKELSSKETDLTLCFEGEDKKNVLRADFDTQQNIRLLLNKIINLQNYKGIGHELIYKAYIVELMVYINNIAFNNKEKLMVDIKKSNIIDGVIDYINDHLEEDITVDELAEQVYLSKFHLSREFKKHTGTTIHRYIVQKKLIKAKELILHNIPVIDVYKQCGFGDYSNFFRTFKNEYGITPKQFYEAMSK
ncbi:AraC family transcriptional regulator [Clostridium swellfunianum]|uniref:AraC family transcriptional regulator n=1 Tax=Clostridium swellfunianum TaxID=1367462 RepID=UPI002030F2B1|nr:AraC family transcriptional regulator [Clostridium swellfunianum]MCM0649948.1 AraC family transcriptional regulator [Clostridium swellfunianum]